MKFRKVPVLVSAIAGAAVGALLVSAVALGQTGSTGPKASVSAPPGFFSEAEADELWSAAVDSYPAALPTGKTFPSRAPAFFHPTDVGDGQAAYFQNGLIESIATSYWRCSWLSATVSAQKTRSISVNVAAKSALARYESLPGVPDENYQKDRDAGTAATAKALGVTAEEAEFKNDCAGYDEGGN